ncbi:unnamed protein product [Parascedosporium putredinis]|uniref:DUF6593 domain-containing protein n=1 Tax=Parascedosporium putredinis TaxID=1442378 RepID=A0A9P1H1F3_9PEZI|nr:unnamed protein product [Parascedosporium putredinis]CAI7992657.1 unnamed protein product [Parascedosporium putredinis]
MASSAVQALVIEDLGTNSFQLTDGKDSRALYVVQRNPSKPHLSISRGTSVADVVGTAIIHKFSSTIDVVFGGQPLKLKRKGAFNDSHAFHHPSTTALQWKGLGGAGGFGLQDEQERTICTYDKKGGFEFPTLVQDQHMLDLIVVTGLATDEYRRRSHRNWNESLVWTLNQVGV